MRRGPMVRLWACLAVAATVVSGSAAATPVSLAASSQWNLNGANNVDVSNGVNSFVYSVTFIQNGSVLTGTLDDSYYPTSGPVSGTVNGDGITFTFNYPAGSVQGMRTYTGTISQSGAVSGTWTETGDESPNSGTWTLESNAVPESPPTPACDAATRAYQADQKALDKQLNQLGDAQNRQTDAENQVSSLTQEVDADKALIAQVNALVSEGQDDARIVDQNIVSLNNTVNQLLGEGFSAAAERVINRLRVIILNALDQRAGEVESDLTKSVFRRAAAVEGEEAAAVGAIIDFISAHLVELLGLPALTALTAEVGKIGTADAALGVVLAQLSPLQDQYRQAKDRIDRLTADLDRANAELDSDNAEVQTLTAQVSAAQAAVQAALTAMTNACRTSLAKP